jgi:ubiquinone biosynthesis protein
MRSGELKIHVHHEYLEQLANIIDKSSDRISISLITAALIVGSSLLVTTSSTTKN